MLPADTLTLTYSCNVGVHLFGSLWNFVTLYCTYLVYSISRHSEIAVLAFLVSCLRRTLQRVGSSIKSQRHINQDRKSCPPAERKLGYYEEPKGKGFGDIDTSNLSSRIIHSPRGNRDLTTQVFAKPSHSKSYVLGLPYFWLIPTRSIKWQILLHLDLTLEPTTRFPTQTNLTNHSWTSGHLRTRGSLTPTALR